VLPKGGVSVQSVEIVRGIRWSLLDECILTVGTSPRKVAVQIMKARKSQQRTPRKLQQQTTSGELKKKETIQLSSGYGFKHVAVDFEERSCF
jgi:hypothetical protein